VSKRKTFGLTVVLALLQASRALATGTGFDWDPAFTTLEQALSGGFATAVGVGGLGVTAIAFAMSHDAGFGIRALIMVVAGVCLLAFAVSVLTKFGIIGMVV
jgi:type IV secretory pathway VirB2 component (pilin)